MPDNFIPAGIWRDTAVVDHAQPGPAPARLDPRDSSLEVNWFAASFRLPANLEVPRRFETESRVRGFRERAVFGSMTTTP